MRVLKQKSAKENTHKCIKKGVKPKVLIFTEGRKRRIIGANAAAAWLGMRQQDFSRIVSKMLTPPPREVEYEKKKALIRDTYPELFN